MWCPGCSPRSGTPASPGRPSSRLGPRCAAGITDWRPPQRRRRSGRRSRRLRVRDLRAVVAGRQSSSRRRSRRPSGLGCSDRIGAGARALDARGQAGPGVHAARRPIGVGEVSDAGGVWAAVAQLTAQFGAGAGSAGWRLDKLVAPPVVSSAQVPVVGYGSRSAAVRPWLAAWGAPAPPPCSRPPCPAGPPGPVGA